MTGSGVCSCIVIADAGRVGVVVRGVGVEVLDVERDEVLDVVRPVLKVAGAEDEG